MWFCNFAIFNLPNLTITFFFICTILFSPPNQGTVCIKHHVQHCEMKNIYLQANYCDARTHRQTDTHRHRHKTHTQTQTHTHTHTHTHVGFYGLRGLSIGVMVFILYKLYVLLPYTYPTPKLSPHRRRCISTFPQKNSLCMIYKRFKLWGHWKCPHKSPSPCNTYVIPISLYKFVSS